MKDVDTSLPAADEGMFAAPGGAALADRLRSLASVGRLIVALVADPRVPVSAKLAVGAGAAYVVLPTRLLGRRGRRGGVLDAVVLTVAVRQLLLEAGYELIHEHWTGTDAGFAWLLAISGVEG